MHPAEPLHQDHDAAVPPASDKIIRLMTAPKLPRPLGQVLSHDEAREFRGSLAVGGGRDRRHTCPRGCMRNLVRLFVAGQSRSHCLCRGR
jgi:hypothetical protein